MAVHSSILAWRISQTEESDGLQSLGSQRFPALGAQSLNHWTTGEVPPFIYFTWWLETVHSTASLV